MTNEEYMARALALAESAAGYTNPNPMVGCVVVKDGKIITEACHERYGQFHAERNALTRCTEDLSGATMYVTLEPCCHYGKTPPCTEIIIEKKIGKVYVAALDSNPKVAGKGVQILRDHGIEVEIGILKKESIKLNEVFYHFIETNTPFVVMKYAMTLDGKIACASGDSKWVTCDESRASVQELRKRYKGIMVGIGTVLADDPMLNCRIAPDADPVRIICDSNLRIPMECQLVNTANDIETIVACTRKTLVSEEGAKKAESLTAKGVTVLEAGDGDEVDLNLLMKLLGERKIDSILLEGGGTLNASALKAGIVNKCVAFIAPKIVGGKDAPSPVGGMGISLMKDAVQLNNIEVSQIADDVCVIGYLK